MNRDQQADVQAGEKSETENTSKLGKMTHSEDLSYARILLVEDNQINQEVALGILETLGYQADVSANGLEALSALNLAPDDVPYDLVLMDCQMPEMDGYTATREIRTGKVPNPDVPVIAMTANAMKGDREKCIAAGMSDYLSKPIDPQALAECLKKWLVLKPRKVLADNDLGSEDVAGVWDEQGFMRRILNNETVAQKLIDLFKVDTPKTIVQMEEAIDREETEKAGLLAHKLKGSVSNLGGIELADLAQKIEVAGKSDDLDEVKSLWLDVKPQFNRLLNRIESR